MLICVFLELGDLLEVSFAHSIAKTLKEHFCPQRTHKLKVYGDATGELNGSGTDR